MLTSILASLFIATVAFAQPADPNAAAPAVALFERLNGISLSFKEDQKILLGMQNAFHEGRGWRLDNRHRGAELRSDMQTTVGVHPAVYGIDFAEIGSWNREFTKDTINAVHARGGVVTMSWHLHTLINDGKGDNGFMDTTSRVVRHILPGGKAHDVLKAKLDEIVTFFKEVPDVPIVFRPWHEHNASWFWWGADHCTREEYVALWRFTVTYLRSKNIHNMLTAYSPAHIKDDFFDRYPGNDLVDIVGPDFYFKTPEIDTWALGQWPLAQWKKKVVWFLNETHKRGKIPVISEFGQEGMNYDRFWTDYMGWPLEKEGIQQITGPDALPARGVAWVLLWRNDMSSPTHFFGPIPGHRNNQNFMDLLSKGIYQGL